MYMYGFKNGKGSMKEEIERLLLIEQGAADLCDKCGWRMKFPNEECRNCENEKLRHEIERLRAALEDIANERGICLTCGKLAIRGPRGAVFCDPHLFGIDQGCRWSPQNPIGLARAALAGEKINE